MFVGNNKVLISNSGVKKPIPISNVLSNSFVVNKTGNVETFDIIGRQVYPVQQGRCYESTGTSEYIDTGLFATLEGEIEVTFINLNGVVLPQVLIGCRNATQTSSLDIALADSGPSVVIGSDVGRTALLGSTPIIDGTVYKAKLTWGGVGNSTSLYLKTFDGVSWSAWNLEATAIQGVAVPINVNIHFFAIYLDGVGVARFFEGKIWNVIIREGTGNRALYKGDEQSGYSAYNSYDKTNIGTINGATLSTFHSTQNEYSFQNQVGYSGALHFDGTGNYVNAGNDTSINSITTNLTVMGWIKRNSDSGVYDYILSNDRDGSDPTNLGYSLSALNLNRAWFRVKDVSGNVIQVISSSGKLTENEWNHLAATFDGTTARLYVAGTQVATTTVSATTIGVPAKYNMALGALGYNIPSSIFDLEGNLRDVRVYAGTRVLTEQEIEDAMNGDETVPSGTELRGQWKLNEMSGTQARDSSASYNHGTINGATWHAIPRDESDVTKDIIGNDLDYVGRVKYNTKLVNSHSADFDGSDDYVNCGTDSSLDLIQNMTISAWFKADSAVPQYYVLAKVDDTEEGYNIFLDNGNIMVVDGARVVKDTGLDYTADEIVHIAIVFSADGTNFTAYKNGVAGSPVAMTAYSSQPTLNLFIGARKSSPSAIELNGKLWDVRVFNTGLTSEQVNQVYNKSLDVATSNLAGWWPLAEGAGTTAYDISGNNNHGTITNATFPDFWATKQDEFHYNIQNGFEYYDDDATGTTIIRVPYKADGTKITPTIAGYTKESDNPALYWHNNAETELQNYLAPQLIQADIADGNDFLFKAGKTAANAINYADIVANVGGNRNIVADVSVNNQKKNLKIYKF